MSFLNELKNQKNKLKQTETVVTNADGKRYIERNTAEDKIELSSNQYGFIVDTKPDDVPALIIDNLYIGSQDCTANHVLEEHKITHVLSLGIELDIPNVTHRFVQCLDIPETDIQPVLNETLPFIHEALGKGENILVHCNAGVSRTSMVVIGYLILYRNMEYDDAYGLVKSKRPAVQPNAGFRMQLKALGHGMRFV